MPTPVHVFGWVLVVTLTVFGLVADRQIGWHVRSMGPYFEPNGQIDLQTTGAFGIVRHPLIMSAGGYLIGFYCISGYPSILAVWAVYTTSALWLTRQEEEHLMALLDDPSDYERYRQRVPRMLPFVGARH